jgi:quinol monooxygenase YgiN
MSASQVTLTVRLRAKDGMKERLKEAGRNMVSATRGEDGCISYSFHEDNGEAGLFLFYEIWASQKALELHLATPHLLEFRKLLDIVLAEPAEIVFWKPLA